ncbi:YigZ family protein [Actinopolyspora erythraea]|uniref:YigZ family protein n=1 Tax=Actinopolyspora erythraea TaxID=414996 RepID=A0A099DB25_9ACTN|nr:YigZ family protein [Actinopolyspora erythraea]ASU80373.1 YigZ family protein [Actinopolyspora erythraea]KGI82545.1 hypothetical protein IL38_03645 [Actinopolyspora erythraea]
MRTIRQAGSAELVEKKSRFRCALERVESEEQAREFVARCRREHPGARHHCYAYLVGDDAEVQKSNDDGEPAGTAGMPILRVLRHNELTNTVAVVVRYFGGVLLGSGGLIRAYGSAVSGALEEVGLARREPARLVSVRVDHSTAGRLDNELRSAGREPTGTRYGQSVEFDVPVPEPETDAFERWITETAGGNASVTLGERVFVEVAE